VRLPVLAPIVLVLLVAAPEGAARERDLPFEAAGLLDLAAMVPEAVPILPSTLRVAGTPVPQAVRRVGSRPWTAAVSTKPCWRVLHWVGLRLVAVPVATASPTPEDRFGSPVWDPSSQAWYRLANGTIVRQEADGGLTVVVDDVQGIDIDVRAAAGVAVSREPNGTIVLHRFAGGRTVLARDNGLATPRLAPDGAGVLVTESRPRGGHVLVLAPGRAPLDLGPGHGPAWLPDGRVIIARPVHDGHRVSASALHVIDPANLAESRIPGLPTIAPIRPTVSDDGARLAFVDAVSGAIHVARMPALEPGGAP
jgi:hypothetical protein